MNYYEHHLGDYLRDTAHLTMVEDGAYRRLLDAYYIKELPLPKAVRDIYRLVRAGSKVEKDAVSIVLGEFFSEGDDGWRHKRCDTEIARYQDKQAKAKRSAEARWGAPKPHSDGNANASKPHDAPDMRTHSDGNALQSPDTNPQLFPEAKASGGDPPPKPSVDKSKSELWKAAVSLLGQQGMPEPQARTFIGKLVKDYPDGDIVLKAVQGAVSEQPGDARAYLKATCLRLNGDRKRDGSDDWTGSAL